MSNDTQELTLTDFLLARIAEEESWVREGTVTGVARERLALDCEAKRGLVELLSPDLGNNQMFDPLPHQVRALRLLAGAYRHHPDYREEWRP